MSRKKIKSKKNNKKKIKKKNKKSNILDETWPRGKKKKKRQWKRQRVDNVLDKSMCQCTQTFLSFIQQTTLTQFSPYFGEKTFSWDRRENIQAPSSFSILSPLSTKYFPNKFISSFYLSLFFFFFPSSLKFTLPNTPLVLFLFLLYNNYFQGYWSNCNYCIFALMGGKVRN